jgi:hypothetical protein
VIQRNLQNPLAQMILKASAKGRDGARFGRRRVPADQPAVGESGLNTEGDGIRKDPVLPRTLPTGSAALCPVGVLALPIWRHLL